MPQLGFGTWKAKPNEALSSVDSALALGYNHIDCAHVYDNEAEVGQALKKHVGPTIARKDLFLTSKLWNSDRSRERVQIAIETTLANLGMKYLDLYLIHMPMDYLSGENKYPKDQNGKRAYGNSSFEETWAAMESLVDQGLVRNIGLSNFNSKQIDRIWNSARIKPSVLQCECHPYLTQHPLINFAKKKDIVFQSYAPIGSPDRSEKAKKANEPVLLDDPKVIELAKKYNKTPGQILLRFHIERGVVVLVKSLNEQRMKDNLAIFDFSLAKEDLEALLLLNRNYRYYEFSADKMHPNYPFKEDG